MGRQHIRDGVLTVKQQKTGKPLAIPVHPELRTVLDATASEHLTFLVTATGKPYPVALVGGTKGQSGTITFGDWNKSVSLSAPKDAIDISQLGAG